MCTVLALNIVSSPFVDTSRELYRVKPEFTITSYTAIRVAQMPFSVIKCTQPNITIKYLQRQRLSYFTLNSNNVHYNCEFASVVTV